MTSYRVYVKFDESDDVLTGVLGRGDGARHDIDHAVFRTKSMNSTATLRSTVPSQVCLCEDAYQDFDLGQALVLKTCRWWLKKRCLIWCAAGADLRVWVVS